MPTPHDTGYCSSGRPASRSKSISPSAQTSTWKKVPYICSLHTIFRTTIHTNKITKPSRVGARTQTPACRGARGRVTIDHFRHSALRTLYGHVLFKIIAPAVGRGHASLLNILGTRRSERAVDMVNLLVCIFSSTKWSDMYRGAYRLPGRRRGLGRLWRLCIDEGTLS